MHLARPPIPSTWRFRSLILSDGLFVPICLRFNSLQLLLKQAPLYMEPSCLLEVQIQGILRSCDSHSLGIVVSNIERFHPTCMQKPPRLQSLTRPLETYMDSSRQVFVVPNIPHFSPQTYVAARRCLGDRLMSDVPLDAHAPITACSGYGFWKLIPISYPIYSNVIV